MELLINVLKFLDFVFIGVALTYVIIIYRRGTQLTEKVSSLYFLNAVLMLAMIRLFFLLDELGLHLAEMTLMTSWHVMFYVMVVMMGFAASVLAQEKSAVKSVGDSCRNAKINLGLAFAIALLVYFAAIFFNSEINMFLHDTWFDKSGMLHLIAFVLSFRAGGFLFRMKNLPSKMKLAAIPLTYFLVFYAIVHAWELLTESWEIIPLAHETIERTEEFFVLPALIFCAYAFYKIYKQTKPLLAPVVDKANPVDSISFPDKI